MTARWIVERTEDARFLFRIRIEQDGRLLLAVRAQSAWPAAGGQVFCLRENDFDPAEPLAPYESVPVLYVSRLGRKLSVMLDRPQRKRCEFLRLKKPRRDGGVYEQIFFRTEAAVRAHRSSKRTELIAKSGFEAATAYRAAPTDGGLDTRTRLAAFKEMPDAFPVGLLRQRFPGVVPARIKRVLDRLHAEGRLRTESHGRGLCWCRADR